MKCFLLLPILVTGFIISVAEARPVSYPEGWTAMFQNNGDRNSAHIHYSPTAKMSIGYKYEHWRDKEYDLHAVQMNNLLKRWNKKESQANIYLKSGLGFVDGKGGEFFDESDVGGFTGMAADWEDRRYFISYENRYTKAGDLDDFYQQSARAGVAPYKGNYGDLHTWLMMEVEHNPEAKDNYTVTPFIRLFKGTHLVEAGMSNHGEALFNYIYRY